MSVFAAACAPPSTLPDGSVSQVGPIGANGIAFDGTDLWLCDLLGSQLLRIDATTGHILERIGADRGVNHPDDLVVARDGSLIYTSPPTGIVGRIVRFGPHAGDVSILARVPVGVNPIALTPDGAAVVVGYGSNEVGRVDRIDLSTGTVTTIASGLPDLNGFSFGPDGAIWAPVGGPLSALTGDGHIVRIAVDTGAVTPIPLSFPMEPGKRGLAFPVSVKWTPSGQMLALQSLGPAAVYDVDPQSGTTKLLATTAADFADNLVTLPDGRTFVSNFVGGISVIDASGGSAAFPLGR